MRLLYSIILFLIPVILFSQAVTTTPSTIEVDQSVTITVFTNSTDTDCNGFDSFQKVYLHAGIGPDTNPWNTVVGNWGMDDGVGLMTDNGDGSWSITFVPETYFGLTTTQANNATKMGMVFRSEDGSEEFKDNGCQDFIFNVGAFQVQLLNPSPSSGGFILVNSGNNTQVIAQNTNGPANYELIANGTSIHTQNNTTFYQSQGLTGITENLYCDLVVSQGANTITKSFIILVNNTQNVSHPSNLIEGINYHPSDATKATLVLNAPNKEFIYVAGSFNNWQPDISFNLYKDPNDGLFWIELTNLTPGEVYTYQYWVCDTAPVSDSPKVVKTADPYSTLVLSPYDDPWIPDNSYPNLPDYPEGQEREVTVLQTNQAEYNWIVDDFSKPVEEDLIVYEVLIRDFDENRTFQDLIDRIDYFKNLNINAIELMPIMEYEDNESWGYNTVFHMALDKYYGPADKFKEFVDLCHQNGIAVILDIAFNHAFGRNPMVRMWMDDPDSDGWGGPSSENPYFNQAATHSYSVGNDFNHSTDITKNYVKRVVKHWIEEFKIDGFRWDLTKGFTQNCSESDQTCTNSYQADRVAVLKEYADYSWNLDPDHYVIFEHLGTNDGSLNEETEWANYRLDEGKGIMLWGEMTWAYRQLTMGWNSSCDITRMGADSRGFNGNRLLGYAESHDKERLMYDNLTYGNNTNSSHNVRDLNTALSRMSALGATSLMVPGPKMIWHFADLGMQQSIYTCDDGSVNTEGDTTAGDCKLATKPQPQWVEDWLNVSQRQQIYNDWAKMIAIKTSEPVFKGDYSIDSNSTDLTPRIYISDDDLTSSSLTSVVILSNFDVISQDIVPDFPNTGTWYNLMDDSTLNVTNTANPITIEAGGFRMYGNAQSTLSFSEISSIDFEIFPVPSHNYFMVDKKFDLINLYDMTGKLIKSFQYSEKNQYVISDLKSDVYVIKIQKGNQVSSQKIIKN
jgi:pullulanase/glycogen debranching enzyme